MFETKPVNPVKSNETFKAPFGDFDLSRHSHLYDLKVLKSYEGVAIYDLPKKHSLSFEGVLPLQEALSHEFYNGDETKSRNGDFKAFFLKNRFAGKDAVLVRNGEVVIKDYANITALCSIAYNLVDNSILLESEIILLVTEDNDKAPYLLCFVGHDKKIYRVELDMSAKETK